MLPSGGRKVVYVVLAGFVTFVGLIIFLASAPKTKAWLPQVPVNDLMNNLKESGVRRAFLVEPPDSVWMHSFNPDEPYQVFALIKECNLAFIQTADSHVYPMYNTEVMKMRNKAFFQLNSSSQILEEIPESEIDFSRTSYPNKIDP